MEEVGRRCSFLLGAGFLAGANLLLVSGSCSCVSMPRRDVPFYNGIIWALGRGNEWQQAMEFPRFMRMESFRPSIVARKLNESGSKSVVGLVAPTWRIIPFSKWLITMVSKFPNWGCGSI